MSMSELNAPIPDAPEFEQYQIYSRTEVIGLLREIIRRRVLVTIHFGGGAQFIVTSLLAINPDFEELVFDCGAEKEANKGLARSNRFTIVTFVNHVKIQFSGQRMEETAYEGTPALRMRMPDSILRFQRREYFRTPVSGKPLLCRIPPQVKDGQAFEVRIVDIGCGGIALLGPVDDRQIETGTILSNCRIDLPEVGTVTTGIEICNLAELTTPTGIKQRRWGCRFANIPGAMVTMIQRYVNTAERNRLSRE
jgi:c-di-GMP-binding flagellar brake protein YcgR